MLCSSSANLQGWLLPACFQIPLPAASPSPLCTACLPHSTLQVHFVMGEDFRVEDLLRLQLHKYGEDVAEIVDRAQKEEKMEMVRRCCPSRPS